MLDQIESVEDRGMRGRAAAQLLKPRQAVRPQHDRLAVDRKALGLDTPGSSRDGWQPRGPVIGVAGVKPHCGAVLTHDQPVTVMLDLVNPIGTRRRSQSFNRLGGDDEPGRKTFIFHVPANKAPRIAPETHSQLYRSTGAVEMASLCLNVMRSILPERLKRTPSCRRRG